jgi:hypothetical protein
MENLFYLLATSFVLRISGYKKFKNYLIGDTGCSVLLSSGTGTFDFSQTSSGDKLYFNEFCDNNVHYGIICIELIDDYDIDEAESLLQNYVSKLKKPFVIMHHTGFESAIDWNTRNSRAFVDYWQDAGQNDWKVKGYTNGKIMAILYVQNINKLDVKMQDQFLDSFHFSPAC